MNKAELEELGPALMDLVEKCDQRIDEVLSFCEKNQQLDSETLIKAMSYNDCVRFVRTKMVDLLIEWIRSRGEDNQEYFKDRAEMLFGEDLKS